MLKQKTLQKFTKSELLFNDKETKLILKFFFKRQHTRIDNIVVTDKIRGFAQALLVEAVNASYALGFVESILRAVSKPGNGFKKILTKFAKNAAKHWLKQAKQDDIANIEIYEIVQMRVSVNFEQYFVILTNGITSNETVTSGKISYS